jgi:hypothetical protein
MTHRSKRKGGVFEREVVGSLAMLAAIAAHASLRRFAGRTDEIQPGKIKR